MIAVLDYGIGNLASAVKAFVHLGVDARLVADPDEAVGADGVVLPGVGAFGPCIRSLRQSGLDRVALHAAEEGVPFLGICVGFQMLFSGSEEEPAEAGLGLLDGSVRRLATECKLPQMQWNQLDPVVAEAGMLAGLPVRPWMYFVHSYAPEPSADTVATCEYGGTVVAAAARGNLWGTQFHPEKSGAAGLALLANFAAVAGGTRRAGVAGPTSDPGKVA
ncbi:MAG: imidazole glycerol phosphate synthase subunit HisH [Acidimicrobiales bacterium]